MLKVISLYVLAIFLFVAGIMHVVRPDFYVKIVPPYLPWPLELVYITGVMECLLALLLLSPKLSQFAAWGIIVFLIAVFPANIYLYQNQELWPAPPIVHLLRLPLQGVFILWAFWHTREDLEEDEIAAEEAKEKEQAGR